MTAQQQRSRPMPAADRRRAIIDAVMPLLIAKGAAVTTAEMAQAAEIAEGTIFRAFPTKQALIAEALQAALDPADVVAALRAIEPSTPLDGKLTAAVRVLSAHFTRAISLVEVLRSMPSSSKAKDSVGRRLIGESSAAISTALAELLDPHRPELRVATPKAIAAVRGLVFASGHPLMPAAERLTPEEIVGVLLSGILRKEAP